MANSTDLKTVPTFTFYQVDDDGLEQPINVSYYNGTIELEQGGDTVLIYTNTVKELFKSISKNLPEAQAVLDRR